MHTSPSSPKNAMKSEAPRRQQHPFLEMQVIDRDVCIACNLYPPWKQNMSSTVLLNSMICAQIKSYSILIIVTYVYFSFHKLFLEIQVCTCAYEHIW